MRLSAESRYASFAEISVGIGIPNDNNPSRFLGIPPKTGKNFDLLGNFDFS
jgi:hypothetical protein